MPSQLTRSQRRILRVIARMQDGPDGYAHDAEGDLSMCSGNLTLTLRTLRTRGLIFPYGVGNYDEYYTDVRITDAGREAIR